MRPSLLLLLAAAALGGCSTQAWYEGTRTSNQVNCSQAPNKDAEQRCLQQSNSKSYLEYQRERESLNQPQP